MDRMLESEEAARRLGVKVATLYAYVSRGVLRSHPAPAGRRSLFDVDEVEQLARRSRGSREVETRMAVITTAITQLTDAGPLYRGRRAVELATTDSYEEVADRLWAIDDDVGTSGRGDVWMAADIGEAVAPAELRAADRLRWAVVIAGALDPVRADLRPPAVARAARRMVATSVAALERPAGTRRAGDWARLVLADGRVQEDSIAARLAARLRPDPDEAVVRAVNAALVLLADHELASSTLAVRVAASTRADPYDAVLAGLGVIGGPLHGAASQLVGSLLLDAERLGVEGALDQALRWQGLVPGFGHAVYRDGDPRYPVLAELFEALAPEPARELFAALVRLAAEEDLPAPNIDLPLGAITWATRMGPEAGQVLFSVARMSGWIAHYLEELGEPALRYRARAVYVGAGRN